jgi:hypothetical protein
MQIPRLFAGLLLLAIAVVMGPVAAAQSPQHTPGPTGRCFTPVTHSGDYLLVTAGGHAEQILRAEPATTTQKVTHAVKHSQVHQSAMARVRVPGPEPNIDGELRHPGKGAVAVKTHRGIGSTGCRLTLREAPKGAR